MLDHEVSQRVTHRVVAFAKFQQHSGAKDGGGEVFVCREYRELIVCFAKLSIVIRFVLFIYRLVRVPSNSKQRILSTKTYLLNSSVLQKCISQDFCFIS